MSDAHDDGEAPARERAAAALPRSVLLVGAGRMGWAMLEGWLAQGLAAERVIVLDPGLSGERREDLGRLGANLVASLDGVPAPQVVVLAVKPQTLDDAAPGLAPVLDGGPLVLSVLAGKTLADLARRLPGARGLVRAMPNTPAAVRRAITAAVPSPGLGAGDRALAHALLAAVGRVEWLDDEGLIDAVTAVSGSGPAYVFHLVEALAAAGAEAGLPADLAARLARATVEGAGELLHRSHESPARLREAVTSPGGTTAAGLEPLMGADGFGPLLRRAVAAAKRRAGELAG